MSKRLIVAIILLFISLLLVILCPSINLMIPFSIIGIVFSFASLVLIYSIKKVYKKKGVLAIANIFGLIVLFFCLLELFGTVMMSNPDLNDPICTREDMVSDCVDKGKGISDCKYMKEIDIPCNSDVLEESQFK